MIIASFQSEYGIRLSSELDKMSWREFSYMLSGLSDKTPLGRIVNIRAESDPEVLRKFTPDQRKARNEYLSKQASNKSQKDVDSVLDTLLDAFKGLAK